MTVNSRLEELYSQIELVRGMGNRRRAQLCLMSFVALLAGESHSDTPHTASPLIRQFAITLNDELPSPLRQTLKPFAPLIIGTRDGHDGLRFDLLLDVARTELLPRIDAEFGDAVRAMRPSDMRRTDSTLPDIYHQACALIASSRIFRDAHAQDELAVAVARLICSCGQNAASVHQRAWYRAKAIDVLDRLCTVGVEEARPTITADQLDAASGTLAGRQNRLARLKRAAAAWTRVRELLPTLAR